MAFLPTSLARAWASVACSSTSAAAFLGGGDKAVERFFGLFEALLGNLAHFGWDFEIRHWVVDHHHLHDFALLTGIQARNRCLVNQCFRRSNLPWQKGQNRRSGQLTICGVITGTNPKANRQPVPRIGARSDG